MEEIGSMMISDTKKLILKTGQYQSDLSKLDIRIYYQKDGKGDWLGTKQGICVPLEYLDPFLDLINKLK